MYTSLLVDYRLLENVHFIPGGVCCIRVSFITRCIPIVVQDLALSQWQLNRFSFLRVFRLMWIIIIISRLCFTHGHAAACLTSASGQHREIGKLDTNSLDLTHPTTDNQQIGNN